MEITQKKLPNSRVQYNITLTALEVTEFYESALGKLGETIKLSGFRAGKAPVDLVRRQIKPETLREEAYTLGVQALWRAVAEHVEKTDKELAPIQDPEVEVDDFVEAKPAMVTFSFDVRPNIVLKNADKIKLPKIEARKIGDKEVQEIVGSLRRNSAKTVISIESAKMDDKVEVSFKGSVKNVVKEKLTSEHFPIILEKGSVIPGFAEELVGLKKNDKKVFTLDFPKNHFDKELAGQKVTFAVTVDEVFEVILPEINKDFLDKFGHSTESDLRDAIKKDLDKEASDELFTQQKAAWLAEFEKCVQTELPQSLVEGEIARSRSSWQDFLASRHLNQEQWLKERGTTLEQMTKDWHKAAESSVRIGLGLATLAAEENNKLDGNEDYNLFLEGKVRDSVAKSTK